MSRSEAASDLQTLSPSAIFTRPPAIPCVANPPRLAPCKTTPIIIFELQHSATTSSGQARNRTFAMARGRPSTGASKYSSAEGADQGTIKLPRNPYRRVFNGLLSVASQRDTMSEKASVGRKGPGRPRKSTSTPISRVLESKKGRGGVASSSRVAKKVVIPNTSSVDSPLSSACDQSDENETPATSVAVTPAESLLKGKVSAQVLRNQPAKLAMRQLNKGVSTQKRKRLQEDDLLEADALLAQALQEEEYDEGPVPRAQKITRKQVLDSDSDEEQKLFGLSDSDLSDVPLKKRQRINRATQGRGRPSRAARATSRPTVKEEINDSEGDAIEDSSAESEFKLDGVSLAASDVSDDDEEELVDEQMNQPSNAVPPATNTGSLANGHRMSAAARRRAQRARDVDGVYEDRAIRERKKLEKAHPEIKTMWTDLKNVPLITPKASEQPTAITRKLKIFQLEGLDWMMRQEKSQWKGGLLGDEMGMGKTIQAVSLIMSDYPAKSPSLVVVPPVALMQWQSEIKEYTDGKLKVLVYHNTNPKVKNLQMKELKAFDVIIISYSGLESIYRKESKGWKRDDGLVKENSKIHAIQYHRLVLDEAHNIKSRTTSCAKACFALRADHKWCLSGTPVQNRIGEFFSLLRFLEVRPFACYFCKKCPCAQLHWNQNEEKKCTGCKHTGFNHVSIFNQELLNPITQGEDPALRQDGLAKLRLVTDRIMLRRMKRDHTASMELPPKEVIIHNEFFGEIERDFSSSIMSNTNRQFDTYVSRGVMLNNYANIFGLIMQMRQVANVSFILPFLMSAPTHYDVSTRISFSRSMPKEARTSSSAASAMKRLKSPFVRAVIMSSAGNAQKTMFDLSKTRLPIAHVATSL